MCCTLRPQAIRKACWRPTHPNVCEVLQATRHHPSAVDLELVKRLVANTGCSTLQRFLSQEFSCIDRDLAGAATPAALIQEGLPTPAC